MYLIRKKNKSIPMRRAYLDRMSNTINIDTAQAQKKKSGASRGSKKTKVSGVVVVGNPPEEILRYADENGIDLILMATHGRSGISRWFIGSVADRVLRSSRVPVLLVRAGISQEILGAQWPGSVLVPLDGSGPAELVLPHVMTLAKQPGARTSEVVLLRVCEPMAMPLFAPPEFLVDWGDISAKHMAKAKRSAKSYLARMERRFNDAGIEVTSEVLKGQPAEEIIGYARKKPFSLIVMATHGRSGLSRWAYGSVAEKVLLAISSPLLLVRPASPGDHLRS